ncbi:hypothetical protein K431DRAFT_167997 [Polychaeton citri CBS 116435]|uniref:Uncharacterized protein n=1 Tax=Polychaeton citri CBS 116435 TaxID=1314669 RepID=A0A9P4UIK3_9PEZI|nr:hypothetical protein K431DRAFT_167997 [Polychaeton citri CBS 116435]
MLALKLASCAVIAGETMQLPSLPHVGDAILLLLPRQHTAPVGRVYIGHVRSSCLSRLLFPHHSAVAELISGWWSVRIFPRPLAFRYSPGDRCCRAAPPPLAHSDRSAGSRQLIHAWEFLESFLMVSRDLNGHIVHRCVGSRDQFPEEKKALMSLGTSLTVPGLGGFVLQYISYSIFVARLSVFNRLPLQDHIHTAR